MLRNDRLFTGLCLVVGLVFLAAGSAPAARTPSMEIEAKPVPGQIDLVQGTAIQLGGKPGKDAPQASSYKWEVIEGEGATLYKEDEAEAIFQAPKIDWDLEVFVVRLTAGFPGEQPSTVRVFIRVHKELSQRTEAEGKRALKKAKRTARRARRQRTVHHHYSPYPRWNVGLYWGWGWPAYYPIFVPIIIPGPGIDWGPGEGEWNPPIAIPYDELVTTFPEGIADDYLPQDFPEIAGAFPSDLGGDLYPEAYTNMIPEVFADPMPGGLDSPGLGGFDLPDPGGFDSAPMIDTSFDVDPFGF